MKKIIVLCVLLAVSVVVVFYSLSAKKSQISPQKSVNENEITTVLDKSSPTPNTTIDAGSAGNNETKILEGSGNYKASWVIVRDTDKIELYSNLSEKLTSADALAKHSCLHLFSGSFYSEEGKHIGLFVSKGDETSEPISHSTFNGYFSISWSGSPLISTTSPNQAKIAIQAGPLLFKDGKRVNLNLVRDENARRIIVATTKSANHVVFITLYDKANTLLGPKLQELGGILTDLGQDIPLDFKDVLNMDGGSHSTFISNIIKLTEISPIGSYFCIKS